MRKYIVSTMAAALLLSAVQGIQAQPDRTREANRLARQANRVNAMAERPGRTDEVLQRISTHTGVAVEQLRALHRNHPDAGASGLLFASVLAAETKKSPEAFLQQHESGQAWAAIAAQNEVPVRKLSERLNMVAKDLAPEKPRRGPGAKSPVSNY